MTRSSGMKSPRLPTGRKRGSGSGTLIRANRSSPVSGSRTKTARLSERAEMYGQRLPRADCERRQHREDLALEELFQLGQLLAVAVVDVADDHAGLSERRTKVALPELGLCRAQLLRAVPNLGQRFLRRAPVGGANGESRLHLAHEPRDPHHEELVQVGREIRAIARPFEQGSPGLGSLVEYAGVVIEPGKLAVERPLRDLGFCRN